MCFLPTQQIVKDGSVYSCRRVQRIGTYTVRVDAKGVPTSVANSVYGASTLASPGIDVIENLTGTH